MDSRPARHRAGAVIPADRIIEEARALRDVRWVHQGRTRQGVDCIGLVVLAMRNAGLDLAAMINMPELPSYDRDPNPELFKQVHLHFRPAQAPAPGVLVMFQFKGDKHPRHFGLVTDNGNIIHAYATIRRVVEHGFRAPWSR